LHSLSVRCKEFKKSSATTDKKEGKRDIKGEAKGGGRLALGGGQK